MRRALPLFIALLAAPTLSAAPRQHAKPRVPGPQVCQTPRGHTATANGKYRGLLQRLHVPQDCRTYGSFRDYGWWAFGQYAGQRQLPPAYWVYHYPYWYLYRSQKGVKIPIATPTTTPAVPRCRPPKKGNPSVNGRYHGLVQRVHAPGDCATYGAFYEYGRYPATSYAGVSNLPAAFWVYHAPHWYLWRHRRP